MLEAHHTDSRSSFNAGVRSISAGSLHSVSYPVNVSYVRFPSYQSSRFAAYSILAASRLIGVSPRQPAAVSPVSLVGSRAVFVL